MSVSGKLLPGMIVAACIAAPLHGQQVEKPVPVGWEFFALPALNFATDEGFGYGVIFDAYNYGAGVQPYRFVIRPIVFLTTKGRRDFVVTFDAPRLLPNGWRLDAFIGREQQLATPYYGTGNDAVFDERKEEPPNPYYYRYGRTQVRVVANVQRKVGRFPARALFGGGFADVTTDATPFDSGTSLLAQELSGTGRPEPRGRIVYARGGLVWDTRNREIGPRSGTWADLLVQRVDKAFGSPTSYTRVTAVGRKYLPLTNRLVFAQRLLAQQTSGDMPLYDSPTIQTSSGQMEGVGGANTVRGLPKNRYVGKGMFLSNSELRWRFREFLVRRKDAHLVLNGFVDAGRVWNESIGFGEILSDLHAGYGGGLRLGLGPSFIVALDVGRSSESTQIYIGLGYPF